MDPPRVINRRGPGEGPVFRTHKKMKVLKTTSPSTSSIKRPESNKSEGTKRSSVDLGRLNASPLSADSSPDLNSTKFKPIRRALSTQYHTSYAPNNLDIDKGSLPKKDKKPSKKSDIKVNTVEEVTAHEKYEYKDLEALWRLADESLESIAAEDIEFLSALKKQSAPACRSFLRTIISSVATDTASHANLKPESSAIGAETMRSNLKPKSSAIGAEIIRSSWCPPPIAAAAAGGLDANDVVVLIAEHGGADEDSVRRLRELIEEKLASVALISQRSGKASSSAVIPANTCGPSPNTNGEGLVQPSSMPNILVGGLGGLEITGASHQSTHRRLASDASANASVSVDEMGSGSGPLGVTSSGAIFATSSQSLCENMESQIVSYLSEHNRIQRIEEALKIDLGSNDIDGDLENDEPVYGSSKLKEKVQLMEDDDSDDTRTLATIDEKDTSNDIFTKAVFTDDNGGGPGGSLRLGKRGRIYASIWDEEDFLEKAGQQDRIPSIKEWSDLLASYSECHDGAYREWLVQKARIRSREQRQKPLSKKQRRIGGIYFDKVVHEVVIDSPPVPVSVHHPACWGLHSRDQARYVDALLVKANESSSSHQKNKNSGEETRGEASSSSSYTLNDNDENILITEMKRQGEALSPPAIKGVYEMVHPAAFTSATAIVQPPGAPSVQRDFEDYDELNLHADLMVHELRMLEASNYARTQHIQTMGEVSSMLNVVKEKKSQLGALLCSLFKASATQLQAFGNDIYQTKPKPFNPYTSQVSLQEDDVEEVVVEEEEGGKEEEEGNEEEEEVEELKEEDASEGGGGVGRYSGMGTRRTAGDRGSCTRKNRNSEQKPQPQLGACLLRHVSFGSFVAKLARGMPVEVFAEGRWRAAVVGRLQFDGILLRHIKVSFLGSNAADSLWISVEDGRLSPPGEHVDLSIFKCYLSNS